MGIRDDYSAQGFETISVDSLDEYRAMGIHLRHQKSGAQIYRVHADDAENLSSFCFRTLPRDSTGVSHILEHSVLCGSRKFPMKDPFLVMINGSVHTFLNAITYPDKTMYPSASVIQADFMNLMRVYADAVFFPLLKPEVFQQEGHHLELDGEGRLIFSGVVFNEMKGAFSSPEEMAGRYSMHSLFTGGPYSWVSGGDPACIPDLSYEAFVDYYNTCYHPSNCHIFLYGDHDMEGVLTVLNDEYLSHFSFRVPPVSAGFQPRWGEPEYQNYSYASGEDQKDKTTITLNWLLGDSTHCQSLFKWRVLSEILLGHSGSPLRKAIMDSDVGEDLYPYSGLETDLREMVFSVGVRGAEAGNREDFTSLVMGKFGELVHGGIPGDLIEGAIRHVEFRGREIGASRSLGLRLMHRVYRGWLYGLPPGESLAFQEHVQSLRGEIDGLFESLISRNLVNNSHRSVVTVSPDSGMRKRMDQEEGKRLAGLSKVHSTRDVEDSMTRLRAFQESPNRPEDLARIPFLTVGDMPAKVEKINLESLEYGKTHEVFSNGVAYVALALDLSGLPADLRPWMPLFSHAFVNVGIAGMSHAELSAEIAMKAGAISCSLDASRYFLLNDEISDQCGVYAIIYMKALTERWGEAVDLLGRIIKEIDFSDRKRVGELLFELRNDFRSAIVPSGHVLCSTRAASRHSPEASWDDLWHGVGQLCFLEEVCRNPEATERASEALNAIKGYLLYNRDSDRTVRGIGPGELQLLLAGDKDWTKGGMEVAARILAILASGDGVWNRDESAGLGLEVEMFTHPHRAESLCVSSAVNFCSLSLPAPVLGSPEYARLSVLAHILRAGYLWETIRMKGGAYGAFASLSATGGDFTFATYRDPEIVSSLDYFCDSLKWAREKIDDSTVERAVIGCVGKHLRPLSPGQKCLVGLKRSIYNIGDHLRQSCRDYQLGVTPEALRETADNLLQLWQERSISIIGGRKALHKAIDERPFLGEFQLDIPS